MVPPLVLRCKTVLVGDAACGKSALVSQFQEDGRASIKTYQMTSGVDIQVKSVLVEKEEEKKATVELLLHDVGGYVPPMQGYLEDASAIAVVFDVTSLESFRRVEYWHETVQKTQHRKVLGVLIGCKVDLNDRRVVTLEQAKEEGRRLGLEYFETSSVHNKDVSLPFKHIAREFWATYEQDLESITEAV